MTNGGNCHEQLQGFLRALEAFSNANCPSWLTPNSNYLGVMPGHNLDLVQIAFDYRIDRTWLLSQDEKSFLKDPSGPPELEVVK
jgi:hypothetical protein